MGAGVSALRSVVLATKGLGRWRQRAAGPFSLKMQCIWCGYIQVPFCSETVHLFLSSTSSPPNEIDTACVHMYSMYVVVINTITLVADKPGNFFKSRSPRALQTSLGLRHVRG